MTLREAKADVAIRVGSSEAFIPAAVAFALWASLAASQPIGDPDVWWIAAAGRDMLRDWAVPKRNRYSFVDADQPWIMHEWLFGPIYAAGLTTMGPVFFALVGVSALGITTWLLIGSMSRARVDAVTVAVIVACALFTFGKRLATPRPLGVTSILIVAMTDLAFRERFGRNAAVLAVVLSWVWVNAHGSFPLGVVLLAFGALDHSRDRCRRTWAALLAALVTLANPYGLRVHGLVGRYLGNDEGIFDFIHANIAEFAPIWRDSGFTMKLPEWTGFLLLSATATAAILISPRWRVRGLLAAGLAGLAALHVRHVEQFGLIGSLLLAPFVSERAYWKSTSDGVGHVHTRTATFVLLPGISAALGLLIGASQARESPQWIDPSIGGPALVGLIEELPDNARVFTPFTSSGLVILYGAPRGIGPLMDPRNDCYRPSVAFDSFALERPDILGVGARTILDRYRVDHVIVPESMRLAVLVASDGAWRRIRSLDGWILFGRRAEVASRNQLRMPQEGRSASGICRVPTNAASGAPLDCVHDPIACRSNAA